MTTAELADQIKALTLTGSADALVHDVTHDSRLCVEGSAFVAIRGVRSDGNQYASQSLSLGAAAVISEQPFTGFAGFDASRAAWLQVTNARAALATAAAAVHGHPSTKLKLVGITGTNGKTTTAHLTDSIIRAAEGTSAMFGTITHRIDGESEGSSLTTPEASDVQRMLAKAVDAGCRSAVMEVSSQAIELHRADALEFSVVVFTNLTRDHLDYHRTMEDYFRAKRKLFDGSLGATPGSSVINIDDDHGRRLLETVRGAIITYGFTKADVSAGEYRLGANGLEFTARTPRGSVDIECGLIGRPHVYNILASVATGLALGFSLDSIRAGIAGCGNVPGRFERVAVENVGFTVVVDYAHTDDALLNVLRTARELVENQGATGRVITVFGCGGDRDRTKRAPMGEIAGRLSDLVIVTSDNPRTEDPERIVDDIEAGLKAGGRIYHRIVDRREAIFRAIEDARAGDLVVIAGKGHETYQIIGETRIHFDDREVAREALLRRVAA